MNTEKIIIIARREIGKGGMESSARLALQDAVRLYDDGKFDQARTRALKSLAYSVGILSAVYRQAIN
jgi:hypothetical protein